MMDISRWDADTTRSHQVQLQALLRDSVESGASIGFLLPLDERHLADYWQSRIQDVAAGYTLLFAASEGAELMGIVMLALGRFPNARYRAEVQKLLVHRAYRRRGIARMLMQALEAAAHTHDLRLLTLDTREGDPANQLYQSLGFVRLGVMPDYVINSKGTFEGSVFYYRLLDRYVQS